MIYVYYTYNPTFQSSQAKLLARPNSVPSCLKHRAKANQRQRCNTTASAPHSFVQLVGGTENSPETRWERPFCQASSPREAWHEIALSELETPQLWLILDYDGLSWINCDGLWWNYGLQWIIYIYRHLSQQKLSCCHGSKSDQRPDICPLPLWAMPSSHSSLGRRDPAMPAVKISWDDELLGAASAWESEAILAMNQHYNLSQAWMGGVQKCSEARVSTESTVSKCF